MYQSKSLAAVCSFIILAAIVWPVQENLKRKPKDSFPLSYFPMFSQKRDSVYTVSYLVGYDAQGRELLVPYCYAGSGGFNQVRRQINKKVKQGKGVALTEKVAKRLAKTDRAPYNRLVRVALMTGTYHLDHYFLHRQKTPLQESLVAETTIDKP
ncbi:MAG: hypothetical protein IPM98_15540 [Lewinellaceae bacterium]|nr:hypothetical protein [Lewinellaceae bacterium]